MAVVTEVSQMRTRREQDWDRYLASLEDAGLDRWIELYQEAYDTQYK